jgi:hypothetical protein
MSMWETPAGPDGGDDIALTTPVSADVPVYGNDSGFLCIGQRHVAQLPARLHASRRDC